MLLILLSELSLQNPQINYFVEAFTVFLQLYKYAVLSYFGMPAFCIRVSGENRQIHY